MGGRRNRKRRGGNECHDSSKPLIDNLSGTLNLNRYLQIKHSDEIGRYLIATEDLMPGTILIQEDPLVIGPNFGSEPTCLRCGKMVMLNELDLPRCDNCLWPICLECNEGGTRKNLHSAAECEILREAAQKPRTPDDYKLFNIITPLRVLLTRKNDPQNWVEIQNLESHSEKIKNNEDQRRFYQTEVVDVFKKQGFHEFSEEDVHVVCGYLQVNSFSVERTNLRALYPRVYLLAHSCVPNTSHVISSDNKMTLRSTVPIQKGRMVTLSYADTFEGTWQRRANLRESKFFDCTCDRCKDPTELGTSFSSLICQKCDKGLMTQENPLEPESPWICRANKCGSVKESDDVFKLMQTAREELDIAKNSGVKFLEDFLKKYEDFFHPNHHIMTVAKCSLGQLYGKVPSYMLDEMSPEQLRRKICLCRDVLRVADVFEPGLSRMRGVTMYELHAPLLLYAIKNYQSGKSNKELLRRRLKEVVKYLRDAAEILRYEDSSSAEGQILTAIETALKETKNWETQLKSV